MLVKENIRYQLTLFINPFEAIEIEKIRQSFNPKQHNLIKAHITLCREDEIENIEKLIENINKLHLKSIQIEFDFLKRFDNDKGVLLSSSSDTFDYDNLRKQILQNILSNPRKQEPHITLIHSRNGTCTDDIFNKIQQIKLPINLSSV